VLPGSDEALARDIAPLAGLKLRVIAFDRPDRGELPLQGGGLRVETALGPIVVYALGGAVTRDDRWHFAIHIANDIAHYAVPALLAIMLVAWRGVRSALAPLRAAGRQTAEINFRSAQARLPDDSRVPSELLPLMQGINRALDRLQEGFLQQQRFTANAAHELRTPLAILRARIDSLEAHADRTGLQRDAQRITSLVDQMLAIARLEQMAPSEATLDLGALAADLVVDFAPLAIDGGREIAFQPPARPVRVRGDTRALASAVGNLIDNALHAEPEGGTVTVTVTDDGMIEVADHGPGICEADRAAMFEPFWRRDEGRVGTGLGLAIVREVATLHGGSARYAENPGGGSVFCLVIPLA
jgi:signal transduction histidine kinase